MPSLTDDEILARWRDEPAPLLAVLHAFHDRDGFLSENVLRAVSEELKIPLADLFGTVTFYHHFSREPGGLNKPRVCTGNVCCLRGGKELLAALASQGATAMPCAGRCDEPVPVLRGHEQLVGTSSQNPRLELPAPHPSPALRAPSPLVGRGERAGVRGEGSGDGNGSLSTGGPWTLSLKPTPLPAPNPGGCEECIFAHIREPGRATLGGYRRTGGYEALTKAVRELTPAQLLAVVTESKLAGRGGAGFPTGVKWKAVADAPGQPKSIVCNADEGEPGCFKDRAIMDYDPHAVLEGMALAGLATGAPRGFIYLRYEYPETFRILERAMAEAEAAGLLGGNILGSEFSFKIHLRRGAGAYICGEEGSLLNSLEGKHPFPRNRPPYPVTHGFENLPTAVNNVETLASVPPIVRKGAAWYRGLGRNGHAGTKLISLSGDIQRPGNYEVPIGLPLKTLLHDWAGGPPTGRAIQAVTMAGLSGGFLAGDALDCTLDEPSIRSKGSFLGAGGIIVFDDSRDMVAAAHDAMEFFAHESCGKCFPCRIGTQRLTERLNGEAGPSDLAAWTEEVRDIGAVMRATSACGLGMAAPFVTDSLLKFFPEQVEKHVGH